MQSVQDLIQGEAKKPEELDKAAIAQMQYPDAIIRWELAHHIVRVERNGMIYIVCTDFDAFNKQMEEEKAEFRRKNLRRTIAEAQEAAYLGEQTTMSI